MKALPPIDTSRVNTVKEELDRELGRESPPGELAQQLGIPREQAQCGSAEAIDLARRETFGLQLALVDPDKPYAVDELAAQFVAGLPPEVAPRMRSPSMVEPTWEVKWTSVAESASPVESAEVGRLVMEEE